MIIIRVCYCFIKVSSVFVGSVSVYNCINCVALSAGGVDEAACSSAEPPPGALLSLSIPISGGV